ncbi:permease prefix domain 1-containing protein [Prauserella cavernicola]|nr:permease prefix domain 1-containing protein [Prauserella cavernicola]
MPSVEAHAAELAASLHGPEKVRTRLVDEIREGLADTIAAHTREGEPPEGVFERAVREFGTPAELAPSCQRELTVAQTRRTSLTVALAVPVVLAAWSLAWGASAVALAVGIVGVVLALGTLAATGSVARGLPVPGWLPLVAAWSGTIAGVAVVPTTLALALTSAASWPLVLLASVLAVVAHGVVAGSARTCRRCARLTPA